MDAATCKKTIQKNLTEFYELRNTAVDKNLLLKFFSCLPPLTNFCLSNAILIFAQQPKAKELKTYENWKEEGFHIVAGEEGVSLLFYHLKEREVEAYVKTFFGDNQVCKENCRASGVQHDLSYPAVSPASLYDFLRTVFQMEVRYNKTPDNSLFWVDYDKHIVTIPAMLADEECRIRMIQAISEMAIQDTLQKRKIEETQFEFCQFLLSFYLAKLVCVKSDFFKKRMAEISENLNFEKFVRCLFRSYYSLQSVTFAWIEFQKNAVAAISEKAKNPETAISKHQKLADKLQAAKRRIGG